MAFRKASYSKVFVDDAIPSFLVERTDAPHMAAKIVASASSNAPASSGGSISLSPALAHVSTLALSNAASKHSAQADNDAVSPAQERRNRSFKLRPRFMLCVILVAVVLNISLHLLLNTLPPLFSAFLAKQLPLTASTQALQSNSSAATLLSPPNQAMPLAVSYDADAALEIITYQSALPDEASQPQ